MKTVNIPIVIGSKSMMLEVDVGTMVKCQNWEWK